MATNSPILATKLTKLVVAPPVRSWVNKRHAKLEVQLKYKHSIDTKRLLACIPENFAEYYEKHAELIKNTPVIAPVGVKEVIGAELPQMQHLTAMCADNVIGKALPPMIILNGLKNLPTELVPFVSRGQIWRASSTYGWETRDTFMFWSICSIIWLSQ